MVRAYAEIDSNDVLQSIDLSALNVVGYETSVSGCPELSTCVVGPGVDYVFGEEGSLCRSE